MNGSWVRWADRLELWPIAYCLRMELDQVSRPKSRPAVYIFVKYERSVLGDIPGRNAIGGASMRMHSISSKGRKMADTMSLGQKLKKKRRQKIKKFGKIVIRGLANFFGRQSLVGDMPIHDDRDFCFLKPFVENWESIRSEVGEI